MALSDPATEKRMQERSLEPYVNGPEAFRKMVLDDIERYGPIVRRLGLKLD